MTPYNRPRGDIAPVRLPYRNPLPGADNSSGHVQRQDSMIGPLVGEEGGGARQPPTPAIGFVLEL